MSHPYSESNEKKTVFMAHNGSMDRIALSSELGIVDGKQMVESEMGLKYIMKNGLCNTTIDKLKQLTVTGLNLLLVEMNRGEDVARLYYVNHYVDKAEGGYYKMYSKALPNGKAVFSSTLVDYGLGASDAVEEGKLILFAELRAGGNAKRT